MSDEQEYTKIKLLGSGSSGEVWLVRDRGGKEWAMKMINSKIPLDLIQAEFERVQSLHHPYIIKYYDLFHHIDRSFLIMEYVDALSLDKLSPTLQPDDLWTIMEQLFEVLAYIHSQKIVHSDIKPDNILFDGKHIKLIDFGLSNYNFNVPSMIGTLDFLAPEQIVGQKQIDSRPRDLWAAGVTIYELWVKETPFYDPDFDKTKENILLREPDFRRIPDLTVRSIVRQLLTKNPRERPTALEVLDLI